MICEREEEIEAFVPKEYWSIHTVMEKDGKLFEAEVNKYSAQLQAKQNQVARNDEEIRQIKLKIADYQAQIDQDKIDVQKLEL